MDEFKNDPANVYFEFLKKFNINFATDYLTSTEISEFNSKGEARKFTTNPNIRRSDKIDRNDPCPCKSGLKYKKCCGK